MSEHGASVYILDQFLSRGWAAVNAPFEHVNSGETMLDNAVKYGNREMAAALIKHGATGTCCLSGMAESWTPCSPSAARLAA